MLKAVDKPANTESMGVSMIQFGKFGSRSNINMFSSAKSDMVNRRIEELSNRLNLPDFALLPLFWKSAGIDDVKFALEADCNLFARSKNGYYPIHLASVYARSDVLKAFLEACKEHEKAMMRPKDPLWASGLQMEHSDRDNRFKTPLQMAARAGRVDNCKLILNAGVPGSEGLLYELVAASWSGSVETAELFFRSDVFRHIDQPYVDPIHVACQQGDYRMLEFLLESGLPAQNDRTDGWRLNWAARENLECVKLLVHHGAEINATDDLGHSALRYAILSGPEEVIIYFLNSFGELIANGNPASLGQLEDLIRLREDRKKYRTLPEKLSESTRARLRAVVK